MSDFYVVVVEKNIVQAIERSTLPPAEPVPRTPLEVSAQLAANNRLHGCIDGRYYFEDSQRARIFAELCLEYTRALVEKRLAVINKLPVGFAEFRADDGSTAHHNTDPSAD
jgi:hypothetical protein